jgi:hypothetical protein
VLAARKKALSAMHVRAPKTLEVSGTIEGAGLQGTFHSWSNGTDSRYDQRIGTRMQSTIRSAKHQYAFDDNGNVREIRGLMAQRRRTEEFIDTGDFVAEPQYDTFEGAVQLPDGRSAYAIQVKPPGGLAETVALDAKTSMIDRISYDDDDGVSTADFYDYRVFAGALLAQHEVDSNGDHLYDLSRFAQRVAVDRPLDRSVFAVPSNSEIQTAHPVTVPLEEHDGHYYVQVRIHNRPYWFLVDTGAQAVVLDNHVAEELGLKAQGHLEVSGAQRTGGLGLSELDGLQIGTATLPLHVVTVLDLRNVTGSFEADGVLGYPFFASSEVTFDASRHSMTFGRPGSLRPAGSELPVDIDRQLVEFNGKVNGVDGRFVLDTGNSAELLLFGPFMKTHEGLLPPGNRQFANNYGVGGSVRALSAIVDELDMGGYRFFNRYANIMLSEQGAFADRFDAGNVGMGVMRNLIVTFDISNGKVYLAQAPGFDDGRRRPRTESLMIP